MEAVAHSPTPSIISLEDALELEERLVVEADEVDLVDGDPLGVETERDGVARERRVALHAREPLLLGSGDDGAVLEQAGGAVVIESGDPEDVRQLASPLKESRSRVDLRVKVLPRRGSQQES